MLNLSDIQFSGPAFPEPFVRFELEKELKDLLPKATGDAGRALDATWDTYRRHLRELVSQGGPIRVRNAVIEPLLSHLGYTEIVQTDEVTTREGREPGGWLLNGPDGSLRVWATALGDDLDAPTRRGNAFRFSPLRIAQRVLLATNERIGLLTNGIELRILLSDPARTDSQVEIPVESHWKRCRETPDSFRLFLALCSPNGIKALPDLVEKARLKQTGVTKELRKQARQAVELFVQDLLDNPANAEILKAHGFHSSSFQNPQSAIQNLPKDLWREGLINIFRLLFILKMESVGDPARVFSFASTSLWRNTFSPSVALARVVRDVLDRGAQTGRFLEDGLRALYRMFTEGLASTEINVKPLGGVLFGPGATPLISQLHWGEHAVAHLLDRMLWTPKQRGTNSRERVHYGPLTVQDLGRVYESLIELDPGITTEPMCRLRRSKLEVVVPVEQGKKYRKNVTTENAEGTEEEETEESEEEESKGKKTKIEWIEEIPAGRFFLRVGLGRKASGSYYTPDSFVKFLVQETLGPLCAERSPKDDPHPQKILDLKVADIAMGSGHFLFETCDFLAEKLYEACRQCDELAMQEESKGDSKGRANPPGEPLAEHLRKAAEYRSRVQILPDPNDELMAYLPSRAPEDGNVGLSTAKALALCKRLVAVHCLYGVDLNPLAVELAKLSLWIETHAEGLPLTFLDHRFVVGNSLTGPFFDHLLKYPGSQKPIDDLFTLGLKEKFTATLQDALREVHDLESTVGINLGEIEAKKSAKARMDALLDPFKLVARAWSGGVMLGKDGCDDTAYVALVKAVAEGGDGQDIVTKFPTLGKMITTGFQALEFDLTFPDVFFRTGKLDERSGFDVVVGNPPWDAILFKTKEFLATFDICILDAATKRERDAIEKRILSNAGTSILFSHYKEDIEAIKRTNDVLFEYQKVMIDDDLAGRQLDAFRVFMERDAQLISLSGRTGVVVPSAFHSNEGATGIRRLYLNELSLQCCYSFENRRKLFEIDSRFKFALVIAARPGPTKSFPCSFYLHDDAWLYGDKSSRELIYDRGFVRRTGGGHYALVELRSKEDQECCDVLFASGITFGREMNRLGMQFQTQPVTLHMTKEAHRFESMRAVCPDLNDIRYPASRGMLIDRGYLYLSEGKTFHQHDELWGDVPRYVVSLQHLDRNPLWTESSRHYRLAFRAIASSTNERTAIFCLLSPGTVSANSIAAERLPEKTPRSRALLLSGICNTHPFDWALRVMTSANVNLFIMEGAPLPAQQNTERYLAHTAARLTSTHAGYAPLWIEQLGDAWRESKPKHTWPVLEGDDERWAVRAAIDAVVAEAYGLTRPQYAHVLSTFSHKSYPKAPDLCLARFDELKKIGLEVFTKKHDPYWDIPLNENLPKPVIDLPEIEHEDTKDTEKTGTKRGRKKSPMVVKENTGDYGPLFSQFKDE